MIGTLSPRSTGSSSATSAPPVQWCRWPASSTPTGSWRLRPMQSLSLEHEEAQQSMDDEYQVTYSDQPDPPEWGMIGRALACYNGQLAGDDKFQRLCFTLRGPDQAFVGGVIG